MIQNQSNTTIKLIQNNIEDLSVILNNHFNHQYDINKKICSDKTQQLNYMIKFIKEIENNNNKSQLSRSQIDEILKCCLEGKKEITYNKNNYNKSNNNNNINNNNNNSKHSSTANTSKNNNDITLSSIQKVISNNDTNVLQIKKECINYSKEKFPIKNELKLKEEDNKFTFSSDEDSNDENSDKVLENQLLNDKIHKALGKSGSTLTKKEVLHAMKTIGKGMDEGKFYANLRLRNMYVNMHKNVIKPEDLKTILLKEKEPIKMSEIGNPEKKARSFVIIADGEINENYISSKNPNFDFVIKWFINSPVKSYVAGDFKGFATKKMFSDYLNKFSRFESYCVFMNCPTDVYKFYNESRATIVCSNELIKFDLRKFEFMKKMRKTFVDFKMDEHVVKKRFGTKFEEEDEE